MSTIFRKQMVGNFDNVKEELSLRLLWKIPNYTSIPEQTYHCIESPSFPFLDATWYLRLYPNGTTEKKMNQSIGLYIVKKHSDTMVHQIAFTLGIIQNDGQTHEKSTNFGYFRGNGGFEGFAHFLNREQVLQDNRKFAPRGELTIVCILRDERPLRVGTIIEKKIEDTEDLSQGFKDVLMNEEAAITSSSNDIGDLSHSFKNVHVSDEAAFRNSLNDIEGLSQDFKNILINEEDTDVIIRVMNKEFRAHRMILKARSNVFKSMFRCDIAEKKTSFIDIADCNPIAFQEFLLFMYSGRLEQLSSGNVFDLYLMAHKYNVKQLKEKCIQFIMDNISVDTICGVLRFAHHHNDTALLQMATSFFNEHMIEIIITPEWQAFSQGNR